MKKNAFILISLVLLVAFIAGAVMTLKIISIKNTGLIEAEKLFEQRNAMPFPN